MEQINEIQSSDEDSNMDYQQNENVEKKSGAHSLIEQLSDKENFSENDLYARRNINRELREA